MSSTYKGMRAETKKYYKYADNSPSIAHSLNLVGESAASCCIESAIFFHLSMNFIISCRHLLIAGKS